MYLVHLPRVSCQGEIVLTGLRTLLLLLPSCKYFTSSSHTQCYSGKSIQYLLSRGTYLAESMLLVIHSLSLYFFSFHLHVYSSLLLMNVSNSTSLTFSLYTVAGIYIPSVIIIVFPFSYWSTCRDFNNYKDRALTTSTPPLPLAVLSFIFLS